MVTILVHRPGTIDWVGLSTPDRESSALFYSDLFDWGMARYETGAGPFVTAEVRGRDAAGILQPQPTIGDLPLPAAWTISIRVDDLDESLLLLSDLGGRIIDRPREIPEIGRSALVADPTGAVFSLAAFHPDFGLAVRDEPGALTWCDLLTRDPVTSVAFYSSLFGWEAEHDDTTGYTMFDLDGTPVAGMMAMPPEVVRVAPSHWLPYFGVTDCKRAARRVRELGGTVHHPPRAIGIGSFAIAEDPLGAPFGILEHVYRGLEGGRG